MKKTQKPEMKISNISNRSNYTCITMEGCQDQSEGNVKQGGKHNMVEVSLQTSVAAVQVDVI